MVPILLGYQNPLPQGQLPQTRDLVPPIEIHIPRINAPGPGEIRLTAQYEEIAGPWTYLRGGAIVETEETLLEADELDYNEDTGYAEGRGAVRFRSFTRGEKLEADRVEYFMKSEKGRFWNVRGSVKPKIDFRPGRLTSNAPFLFQARWAERDGARYILYDATVTDCRTPRPWWFLRGPRFDVVPGERVLGYHSRFVVKDVPVFYTPVVYKSLEAQPRKSGFLMPIVGNSSRRGKIVKAGYFWAINRSYDALYQSQWFTQRGFAHDLSFRGKPTQKSDFSAVLYGVNDRGLKLESGDRIKQGGYIFKLDGRAEFKYGFWGRAEVNHLSSLVFRQAFTESFYEAVGSEVHTRAFVARQWSSYSLGVIFERNVNYQTAEPGDRVLLRKLPEVDFTSRDRQLTNKVLPLWFSFDSTAGLLRRNQPLFETRRFVERLNFAPRVMTAVRWKDIHILPAFGVQHTHYGSSFAEDRVSGQGVLRSSREFSVDLVLPSLSRIYTNSFSWLGEKVKHVIEPRAAFRHVAGIDDFSRQIRFDEMDILTNTTELDYSLTNRVFVKKGGSVNEVLTWQLWQKRFFDTDLGGAVLEDQRNVVRTQAEMTGYAFFDQARKFSPVVSSLRGNPTDTIGFEWRSDYDPQRRRIVNSALLGSVRVDKLSVQAGHNHVRSNPRISPSANQVLSIVGWGRQDLRGLGLGFLSVYDFRLGVMQFATIQASYNSECCGLSVQYRRFSFGARNENQWRVAFAVANFGSFGNLKVQERLF